MNLRTLQKIFLKIDQFLDLLRDDDDESEKDEDESESEIQIEKVQPRVTRSRIKQEIGGKLL